MNYGYPRLLRKRISCGGRGGNGCGKEELKTWGGSKKLGGRKWGGNGAGMCGGGLVKLLLFGLCFLLYLEGELPFCDDEEEEEEEGEEEEDLERGGD
jgi:hypothetical protein